MTLARGVRPAGSFVHRKNVLGFRTACEEMWGPTGLERTVASLPAATRNATAGLIPLDEWIPVEFLIAWSQAIWDGPANKSETQFRLYVAATVRHGFGRVKKLFLGMLPPAQIAPQAARLWKDEYTTGTLTVEVVAPRHLRARLHDHAYVESALMRLSIAEAFRTVISLTRASEVTETHPPRGSPLIVDVRWQQT